MLFLLGCFFWLAGIIIDLEKSPLVVFALGICIGVVLAMVLI